jgi:hypothetical protein
MKNMENMKCQCDYGYGSCKGNVEERDLKKDFQWDIKVRNYKLNLCDYHYSVIHYKKTEILELLKNKC